MRRKQGRLKPGGQYLNPTRADTNSADKVTNTGDKDTSTEDNDTSTGDKDTSARDKYSNMKNKYAKERDESAENKDVSSLTKASSAENDSFASADKRERGKTRNLKKTEQAEGKQDLLREGRDSSKNGTNLMSPSEQPEVFPQVCIGDIFYLIYRLSFYCGYFYAIFSCPQTAQ